MSQLWCVGKVPNVGPWQFIGVFDSRELAIAACKSWEHFVAPCQMNQAAPDEAEPWPGAFYPVLRT